MSISEKCLSILKFFKRRIDEKKKARMLDLEYKAKVKLSQKWLYEYMCFKFERPLSRLLFVMSQSGFLHDSFALGFVWFFSIHSINQSAL